MKRTRTMSSPRVGPCAVVVLIVTLAVIAPTLFAKISLNTIDPGATVSHGGTRIRLSGPIQATAGERVQQRVTVVQRSTGAVAEGFVHFHATGQQQWEVIAHMRGGERFAPAPPPPSEWPARSTAATAPPMRISGW